MEAWQARLWPLALHTPYVGTERFPDPAVVSNVLPQGALAVDVGILFPKDGDQLRNSVIVVLVDKALGFGGKSLKGLLGPPRDKATSAVVLPALVVEAMCDLVPNHLPEEEWRLWMGLGVREMLEE